MSPIKIASTQHPVIDLIKNRWSPRSFSTQTISQESLQTILEAGSWAPSANNQQPWRFIYGYRGTPGFDKIVAALAPGNQPWAKNAAVLVAAVGVKELPDTQQKNHYYMYDTGLATSFILLQAQSMGIYAHVMGGFNKQHLAEEAAIPSNEEPVVVIALGYADDAEKLEEPYKTRELTPRNRKPLDVISAELV
ncbi:nitroreductase family protein [Chitinophaga tropicalis]|uniref:Nitroreductase n=1 Tax=Chitinophaga tropicalis TaxID=2683588 RepID=A0A7K1U3E5_9BACT|nr:nitroreductase family protein [Chitinophaga tropicalis]MVT08525.1 nitroreductase [Chitinophaga tropicalis]